MTPAEREGLRIAEQRATRKELILTTLATVVVLLVWTALGHATWKPEYGKSPEAVQDWFKNARTTPLANLRLGWSYCCEQAEQLHTKFVGRSNGEWSYYPDPACTTKGCALLPIPNDVVHQDRIRALDPKDDALPEFEAMRREGVLFIYNGKPTCFWPPDGGI